MDELSGSEEPNPLVHLLTEANHAFRCAAWLATPQRLAFPDGIEPMQHASALNRDCEICRSTCQPHEPGGSGRGLLVVLAERGGAKS
jgi:hypothetical protein